MVVIKIRLDWEVVGLKVQVEIYTLCLNIIHQTRKLLSKILSSSLDKYIVIIHEKVRFKFRILQFFAFLTRVN